MADWKRFKAGDRVENSGWRGTVFGVGRNGVGVDWDNGGSGVTPPEVLDLIADTVTVTVELTREQAEDVVEKWIGGPSDDSPSLTAAGVVKEAIREALS